MIERRKPLKRPTPVRKRRLKLRRGEPTPEEKENARTICYARAKGMCQLRNGPHCLGYAPLNALDGHGHQGQLCHLRGKRRFGWAESEETGQKHLWGCWRCHQYEHQHGHGKDMGD
jgi:hypothetical protein